MKCRILHETGTRLRVRLCVGRMTLREADVLEYSLRAIPGVVSVSVYDRTCDAVIFHTGASGTEIKKALAAFSFEKGEESGLVPVKTARELNRSLEERLTFKVIRRFASKMFLPFPIRAAIAVFRSVKYIKSGLESLAHGKLAVPVLDAAAVTVSLIRGDFDTAGSVMFMLGIGEMLEEWTRKKSLSDLAGAMSLNVDKVWMKTGETEILVPVDEIPENALIVVRTGNMIPLDGRVVSGNAAVNQSSMTGESLPVQKSEGSYVYAGTVVEDGECVISVDKTSGTGRYDRIVRMIEESEKLKSTAEDRASRLADRLVPYTLGGTVLTWLVTRNAMKTLSVLMVDFSCALKLSMPIAVLSAMKESSRDMMSVKGGRFLEAVANADTVVFDKTGTLTHAQPQVASVVTFGGTEESEMLRLAACLEEHYPHSLANAVVEEAKSRGLSHEEYHSSVEYVVAHGISSMVDGRRVIVGSYHFVFEDSGCTVPEWDEEKFASLPPEYSHLYLAISGVLAAVICISDPIRDDAADAIAALHSCGIKRIVMMTGDNERTAAAVAEKVGVDEFHAGVLPEDKAEFIKAQKAAGHTVMMIGDGVNDTPALSEADVGIAINTGAAIAREVADITISCDGLHRLVVLRELAQALMKRINGNYRFIVGFNLALIILGVTGVIQPTTSALLHNMSTLGISVKSMTPLLGDGKDRD